MPNLKKQSIYRIMSDLIKADKIIDINEINLLKQICCVDHNCKNCKISKECQKDSYEISSEDRLAARNVSLAEALNTLKSSRGKMRQDVYNRAEAIALSDGSCCREEALLLMAYRHCLLGYDNKEREDGMHECHEVISVPRNDIDIDSSQVIYLESLENKEMNDCIVKHFRAIHDCFKTGGFEFIYIPRIVDRIRETGQETINGFIKYLAPTATDNETKNISTTLTSKESMTTSFFYHGLLSTKLGIELKSKKPVLLFKISDDVVGGKKYTNYLSIELRGKDEKHSLEENVREQISELIIDKFILDQKLDHITIQNYTGEKKTFIYTGFYKTLFDLTTLRKGKVLNLIVKPKSNGRVLYIQSEEKLYPIELGPQESIFYLFSICETFLGTACKTNAEYQNLYEKFYCKIRGGTPADINRSEIVSPFISRIKGSINALLKDASNDGLLYEQRRTLIPHTKSSGKRINVYFEHINIKVDDPKQGLINFTESDIYKTFYK